MSHSLERVYKNVAVKGPAKAILAYLVYRANDDDLCWCGLATIDRECGIAKKTRQRHIDWLIQHGHIEIIEGGNGAGHPTYIKVNSHYTKGVKFIPLCVDKGVNIKPLAGNEGGQMLPPSHSERGINFPKRGSNIHQRGSNLHVEEQEEQEEERVSQLIPRKATKARQRAPDPSPPPELEPSYFDSVVGTIVLNGAGGNVLPSDHHNELPSHKEAVRLVGLLMQFWEETSGGRPKNDSERAEDFIRPCNQLLKRLKWDINRAKQEMATAYNAMIADGLTVRRPLAVMPQVYAALGKSKGNDNWLDRYLPVGQVTGNESVR